MYDALDLARKSRFKEIDSAVRAGDTSFFDRQGWAYFVDIDKAHTAMASFREADNVFYWLLIGPSDIMPVIL